MKIDQSEIEDLHLRLQELFLKRKKLSKSLMEIDTSIIGIKERLRQIKEENHYQTQIDYDIEDEK